MTIPGAGVMALPAHLRRRLAEALATGMLPETPSQTALESVLGTAEGGQQLASDLEALAGMGVRGEAVALWIRTVEQASDNSPAVDLVWSGPEVPGLHARDTRRVYEELVRGAQHSVWISTYAYFDGPRAFADLAQRLEAIAGLRVSLLLNIQRTKGDTTDVEHLVRRFADRFWGTDWPGTSQTLGLLRSPLPGSRGSHRRAARQGSHSRRRSRLHHLSQPHRSSLRPKHRTRPAHARPQARRQHHNPLPDPHRHQAAESATDDLADNHAAQYQVLHVTQFRTQTQV